MEVAPNTAGPKSFKKNSRNYQKFLEAWHGSVTQSGTLDDSKKRHALSFKQVNLPAHSSIHELLRAHSFLAVQSRTEL